MEKRRLLRLLVSLCLLTGILFSVTAHAEGGVIRYYAFDSWPGDPLYKEGFEELKAEFEALNPGFTLEISYDPWGTWTTKLPTMIASGNAPDVFLVNNPDFPAFANGGFFLDLTDHVDPDYFDEYFPGVLAMYTQRGRHLGIPYSTDCRVLWYNTEIFELAGLDPNQPPETWEEMKAAAAACSQVVTDRGQVYGFGMDLKLREMPTSSLLCAVDYSMIDTETFASRVLEDPFVDYLRLLADMKPYYEPDFNALDHQELSVLFAQQRVAMIIAGTWPTNVNPELEEADWYKFAMIPRMDESSPHGSFGGGFGMVVSAATEHPEQAVSLAKLMCSEKYNAKLMSDIPPTSTGVGQTKFGTNPKYEVWAEQIKYARQAQAVKTVFYSEIDLASWEMVSRVINGDISPEDAAKELDQAINDIVNQ